MSIDSWCYVRKELSPALAEYMDHNNILVLGAPGSGKIRLAQFITKDYDTSTIPKDTHSGLVYNTLLVTKYFTLNINLLIEEFPPNRNESTSDIQKCFKNWYEEFCSDDITELREVIEGVVFTLNMDGLDVAKLEDLLLILNDLKQLLIENDCFFVVMGISNGFLSANAITDIEDQVIMNGFEFVNFDESGTNEFKEKVGPDRMQEIFESHEWSQTMKSEITEADYIKHKHEKMLLMSESLLGSEGRQTPLLENLMGKLRLEKAKVTEMDDGDKQNYIESLVEEFLEYF